MPVHLRLNNKDTSRNPYINFVTALPGPRHDEALRRLQQLAAMVKPLMKDQAFHINSLEEYEHNQEFAGRCWNNGEVIELVLTLSDGSWRPLQFVLYVFCHELAHIKHMNHIPHLHGALTNHLKQLALTKQSQGYYGDGLWSSGRQLQDGGFTIGLGMNTSQQNLPDQVCGGAFRRPRAQRERGKRRQRQGAKGGRKFKGPSLHTGAQTSTNTRGGNRRVKLEVEGSGGNRLDGKDWFPIANAKSKDYKLDENSTFRKRAQSKDAREKRAAAALARFSALQASTSSSSLIKSEPSPSVKQETKRDLKVEEEDSVTEEESSEDEDQDDTEDDSWLVGNDLGEADPKIKQEDDGELQFTQADNSQETADQRKRRMKRFDEKNSSAASNDNDWQSLLHDVDASLDKKRKLESSKSAERNKKVMRMKEEESDDEVVLVDPPRQSTSIAPIREWTCHLCTLLNPMSTRTCAACETPAIP